MSDLIDIHDKDFQTFVVHNLPIIVLADLMRVYSIYHKQGIRPITREEELAFKQALDGFGV